MALFQTDRRSFDVGNIHIEGFMYSTDDPDKIAFLRKNISPHLWEIVLNKDGGIKGVKRGQAEDLSIETQVVEGETLIKPHTPKVRRGMRMSGD